MNMYFKKLYNYICNTTGIEWHNYVFFLEIQTEDLSNIN
jgi:hypothetical protein